MVQYRYMLGIAVENSQHKFALSIHSSVRKHVRNRVMLSRMLWDITMRNSAGFCWVLIFANVTQQYRQLFTNALVGFCGQQRACIAE
jgi:hypothetical protein